MVWPEQSCPVASVTPAGVSLSIPVYAHIVDLTMNRTCMCCVLVGYSRDMLIFINRTCCAGEQSSGMQWLHASVHYPHHAC